MLPSTVEQCCWMAAEPIGLSWILVFGQETGKTNIEVELLKRDRHLTASCVDVTKEELLA